MNIATRILALRLLEKMKKNQEYAQKLGLKNASRITHLGGKK